MQIRTKITAIFILLTGLLQILIFVFIYLFSKDYTENEFYFRLKQRATIAAQTYLAEDELNVEIYEEIRNLHLRTLPNETEIIHPVEAGDFETFKDLPGQLPESFYKELFQSEYSQFKKEEYFYTGLLYHDNQGDFIIILSAQDLYGEKKLENLGFILILAFLISLVFISFLGQYYAKQALSPISKMITKVNSIKAQNLYLRLDSGNGKDELAELAQTFNSMLDRLEISFDLQSNFINNASHELRNPLTAILVQSEVGLSKNRSVEEYKSILKGIEVESMKLDTMVNGLLKLARADFDRKGMIIEPLRIDEIIIEVKHDLNTTISQNKIRLDFSNLPKEEALLEVLGSETLLKVALKNIMENACKFSQNEEVEVKLITDDKNIKVIISDKGVGIPPEELKSIFEPFFRGTNVRQIRGFGFGLPLAYRIVKLHSGEIKVTSQEGKGTIVKICIPNKSNFNQSV